MSSSWEDMYKGTPPWDIGKPQPAFTRLVGGKELRNGRVLDVGCGTGENALFLAQNGYLVTGVDLASPAIRMAKSKAKERNVNVDFQVANALSLDFEDGYFDNVIDSGLFHTFSDEDRPVFVGEVARVLAKEGNYFMLCFSEKEPTNWGGPRRVTEWEIRATFSQLFRINYVKEEFFATRIHEKGGRAYLTSATKLS